MLWFYNTRNGGKTRPGEPSEGFPRDPLLTAKGAAAPIGSPFWTKDGRFPDHPASLYPPYPKTRPSEAVVFLRGRFAGICEHLRLRGCEPFRQIRTKFWRGRFGRIIQVSALGSAPDILPNKDERAIPANKDESRRFRSCGSDPISQRGD